MELLRLDRLSEAQALAILKLARWELLELMGRYDVPAVRMSAEELDHELATEVKRNGTTSIVSDAGPIVVFARIGRL